jgi:SAM-dependent methyltransferase
MATTPDSARRFSGRVDDYVRGRPSYPEELFDDLVRLTGLVAGEPVADVGSGTGIASAPLLARGLAVFAIEPNEAMRFAAESRHGERTLYRSVSGSAEATRLVDGSVALVIAAQAYHWFDPEAARREFRRILRPGAPVALVWNARRAGGTPFAADYERLLLRFGTDYGAVGHRGVARDRLELLFGESWLHRRYLNAQDLDFSGLRARLLSSSYVPAAGRPGNRPMLAELERLFRRHQRAGVVRLDYDVDLYLGEPAA